MKRYTLQELYSLIESSGIPFRYAKWNTTPPEPYGTYETVNVTNFYADGILYVTVQNLSLVLYTKTRDLEAEKRLESVLQSFSYTKATEYNSAEKIFETTYEMEVILTNDEKEQGQVQS